MKQAGTQDFWVLNWNCLVTSEEKIERNAIGGTGKFKNVSGSIVDRLRFWRRQTAIILSFLLNSYNKEKLFFFT